MDYFVLQVSVWWAGEKESDDVTSACWPQDLYKVGEYDSDEGELWADDEAEEEGREGEESGSEASWTTESETEVELDDSTVFHTDEEDKKGSIFGVLFLFVIGSDFGLKIALPIRPPSVM